MRSSARGIAAVGTPHTSSRTNAGVGCTRATLGHNWQTQPMGAATITTRKRHAAGPIIALLALLATWSADLSNVLVAVVVAVLVVAVITAVHHAEVVSARVGEPYGALILALAVTIIEVGLIVAIMASSSGTASTLGRDTVFSAIMITCNGIIGLSVVAATLKQKLATFNAEGSGAALGAITVIATLSLVLPTFTRSSSGPTFTTPQLIFASIASLGVYILFLFALTVRYKEHFQNPDVEELSPHPDRPSSKDAYTSLGLLVVALIAIVGLAKVVSPAVESGVRQAGLPLFVVAVVVALVVLLPESFAAVRSARRGDLQTSFNLGYGSAMASIGLTIPALAIVSSVMDITLELGLNATEIVLLVLTVVVGAITTASPRATLLQGGLHLVIFASFLVLAISP